MINIWLALREEAVAELNGWAAAPETITDDQRMVMDAVLSHPDIQHIEKAHKKDTNGGKQWTLYSMYTSDSAEVMANLESWLSAYAGKAYIIGAWHFDGTQWGTHEGEPLYPTHPRSLKYIPDDVTYDEAGAETSRTPAVALKQVNLMAGQMPRSFS